MSKTVFDPRGGFTPMAHIVRHFLRPFARVALRDTMKTSPNVRVAVVRAGKLPPPPADPAWNMDPEEYEYLWQMEISDFCGDVVLMGVAALVAS